MRSPPFFFSWVKMCIFSGTWIFFHVLSIKNGNSHESCVMFCCCMYTFVFWLSVHQCDNTWSLHYWVLFPLIHFFIPFQIVDISLRWYWEISTFLPLFFEILWWNNVSINANRCKFNHFRPLSNQIKLFNSLVGEAISAIHDFWFYIRKMQNHNDCFVSSIKFQRVQVVPRSFCLLS